MDVCHLLAAHAHAYTYALYITAYFYSHA